MSEHVFPNLRNKGKTAQEFEPLGGLTKRELFAAMALHAIMPAVDHPGYAAEMAVKYADALIAELAKSPSAPKGS